MSRVVAGVKRRMRSSRSRNRVAISVLESRLLRSLLVLSTSITLFWSWLLTVVSSSLRDCSSSLEVSSSSLLDCSSSFMDMTSSFEALSSSLEVSSSSIVLCSSSRVVLSSTSIWRTISASGP